MKAGQSSVGYRYLVPSADASALRLGVIAVRARGCLGIREHAPEPGFYGVTLTKLETGPVPAALMAFTR